MRRRLGAVLALLVLAAGCAGSGAPAVTSAPATATLPAGVDVVVRKVIDGDTIEVSGGERVRLIGIDTPETVHPSEPVGCYGPAASSFTERMLEGQTVRLGYDVERTDQYGRTLAYVFASGLFFNETLVRRGYAKVATYPPNIRHSKLFAQLEREAREAGRGLWSADTCSGEID